MSHKILRKPDVLAKLGIKETWLKKMVNAGEFPKPIKLGGDDAKAAGWVESEVDAWIDAKIAERDGVAVAGGAE